MNSQLRRTCPTNTVPCRYLLPGSSPVFVGHLCLGADGILTFAQCDVRCAMSDDHSFDQPRRPFVGHRPGSQTISLTLLLVCPTDGYPSGRAPFLVGTPGSSLLRLRGTVPYRTRVHCGLTSRNLTLLGDVRQISVSGRAPFLVGHLRWRSLRPFDVSTRSAYVIFRCWFLL